MYKLKPKITIGGAGKGTETKGFDLYGELAMNLTDINRGACAEISSPEEFAEHFKKAKNPLFIVGPWLLTSGVKGSGHTPIDTAAEIAKAGKFAVCATGDTAGPLKERGVKVDMECGILEITGLYLTDASWKGVNGKGQHDFVLFNGVPCYFAERALNTLLLYAPWLKTYTICHRFHHSADYTWPRMNAEAYGEYKKKVIELLKKAVEEKEAEKKL
ncbi:MAG: carbon monoxide dehydrogenase beta subunit family protein [Methanobacteriaceae archaeon]|jgi:CO dehydrogenase/acetyl-CoA synthase complex epsilon subunit